MTADRSRPMLLGRPIPAGFVVWQVVVGPGQERGYDPGEWTGALVILESGELELVGALGSRHRVQAGDLLWLAALPLRALRNPGAQDAVLTAVTRAPTGRPTEPTVRAPPGPA